MNGWDLWEADIPEPEATVEGLIFSPLTLLAGRPKIGKSLFALNIALAVISGERALGSKAVKRPGAVLYCDLENARPTTKKRLRDLLGNRTPYLQNLTFVRRLPRINEGGLDLLDQMLTERPYVLVIIDTLAKIVMPEKNRDAVRSDYGEIDRVRRLAEKHQCALLLVTHTRKMDAEYALDAVSGTTGVTAAADAVLVLKHDGRGGYFLSVTGRDIEATDLSLIFQDGRWTVKGTAADTDVSDAQQQVLDLFRNEGGPGVNLAVEKIARLTGRPLPATYIVVSRMVKDGLLARVGRGNYRATYPSL
jgi:hypothetical protein